MMVGLTPMFGMMMAACTMGKLGSPTNLITGHIVTLSALGTKVCLRSGLTASDRQKVCMSSLIIACTFFGAGIGAAACYLSADKAEGLLLPVPPSLAVLLWCYDHTARPRSLVKRVQRSFRERRAGRQPSDEETGATSESDTSPPDSDEEADAAADGSRGGTAQTKAGCDDREDALRPPHAEQAAPSGDCQREGLPHAQQAPSAASPRQRERVDAVRPPLTEQAPSAASPRDGERSRLALAQQAPSAASPRDGERLCAVRPPQAQQASSAEPPGDGERFDAARSLYALSASPGATASGVSL